MSGPVAVLGLYTPEQAEALMDVYTKDLRGSTPLMAVSFIGERVTIGRGSKVWHYAVVLDDVVIGENCSVGSRCEVGRGSIIGDGSRIGSGAFLPPNTRIGRNVFVGPNVTMTDDRHPKVGNLYHAEPPVIGDDAAIGAGAVLLPGVVIGAGARIGAGAVVTKDVAPNEMVRGEPARTRARSEAAKSW